MSMRLEKNCMIFFDHGQVRQDRKLSSSWSGGMLFAKVERGQGLGNLVSKNIIMGAKWLWHFPLVTSLWHRVICIKYGLRHNGRDANLELIASFACPMKYIS